MKNSLFLITSLTSVLLLFSQRTLAVFYHLPKNNSRLIGENLEILIPKGNRLPLESFAARYQIGLSNMLEVNPGIDVYLPQPVSRLIIPQQLILPDTPREGIIINSPEMRLYYYPKGTKIVIVLPIGIGEIGKNTPTNWTTTVKRKKANPTWTPTKKMREEFIARGERLPYIIPAGSDNPMGKYALYVGRLYAIHGTNANFGIGLRVSHGCVRMRSNDIKWLYDHVPVGTRVQFINQTIKATVEPDGSRYVEIHNPLSTTEKEFKSHTPIPITLTTKIRKVITEASVNQIVVDQALQERSGVPILINNVTKNINKKNKNEP